jgi:hypothetical protein
MQFVSLGKLLPQPSAVQLVLPRRHDAEIRAGLNPSDAKHRRKHNMSGVFQFGERLDGYAVPVLNERAVRAAAGILFALALGSFMNAWLLGNFRPTRVFVVGFLIDFTIRIFVNPRYSPSLIVGQWFVRRQQPEYVGAAQKRFAWAIGFVLGATMLYLIVLKQVVGPVNLLVCGTCMLLLFFESAFGICIGCKVYELFAREKAQLCPGGVCETDPPRHLSVGWKQGVIVAAFAALLGFGAPMVAGNGPPKVERLSASRAATNEIGSTPTQAPQSATDAAEQERCRVPEFAKKLGHEEMWKLHNNCK